MDGKKLDFDGSGCGSGGGLALRGSNFTMRDRETCSRWQQATGEAFEGPLKGKRLPVVPFRLTTWGEWLSQHPETLALVPEPRYEAQYDLMGQMIVNLRRATQVGVLGSESDRSRAPLRNDPRLPPTEQIFGLEIGGNHKAYPLALLRNGGVVNDQMGATPVLLVHAEAGDTTSAFTRQLGGRTLTFRRAKSGGANMVDAETGSTWTPYGECIGGRLKGEQLEELTALPSFWFSWAQFFPDTEVYK